jgi:hypothetical protein
LTLAAPRAAQTPDAGVVQTVAARECSHGPAFARVGGFLFI